MCDLTKQAYESDTGEKLVPLHTGFDTAFTSIFGPGIERARILADKIHRAAETCRQAEQEDAE